MTDNKDCHFEIIVHSNPKAVYSPEELAAMPAQLRDALNHMAGKTSVKLTDAEGNATLYMLASENVVGKAAGMAVGGAVIGGIGLQDLTNADSSVSLLAGTPDFDHFVGGPPYAPNGYHFIEFNLPHLGGFSANIQDSSIIPTAITAAAVGTAAALAPHRGKVITLPEQFATQLEKDAVRQDYTISQDDFSKLKDYLGQKNHRLSWPIAQGSPSTNFAVELAKKAGVELDGPELHKHRTGKGLATEILKKRQEAEIDSVLGSMENTMSGHQVTGASHPKAAAEAKQINTENAAKGPEAASLLDKIIKH